MTQEELIELVEFADEDLIRSVTDEMVDEVFSLEATDMNNSGIDEVINFLLSRGHTVEALASALGQIGAIQEDPHGFSG